jgi:hypothetical protein
MSCLRVSEGGREIAIPLSNGIYRRPAIIIAHRHIEDARPPGLTQKLNWRGRADDHAHSASELSQIREVGLW